MATGLNIPIAVGAHGGLQIASGDQQDNNIIALALGSQDNENAFQQEDSAAEASVFEINDELGRAAAIGRVRRAFETFERLKRFKLVESSIQFVQKDGDLILSFKYLNLETDQEQDFARNLSFQGETVGEATNG